MRWRPRGEYASPFSRDFLSLCDSERSDSVSVPPKAVKPRHCGFVLRTETFHRRIANGQWLSGFARWWLSARARRSIWSPIVARGGLCFQERARSRIGGSPEEALHDRGVFSGHHDECRGPGARQGTLNPRTSNHTKTSTNQSTNQPSINVLHMAARASCFLLQLFRLLHGYSPGYNTP